VEFSTKGGGVSDGRFSTKKKINKWLKIVLAVKSGDESSKLKNFNICAAKTSQKVSTIITGNINLL